MSRTAFLFPGQGSQRAGMGRALADEFPESRSVFEEADRVLGEPLSALCFAGPDEELRKTRNTQPALLAVSVAAWRALDARAARPAAVAGHSLGEYAALVAAGSLDFSDAISLVRRRGEYMQEAVPDGEGAMLAVMGLDPEDAGEACREAAGRTGGVVEPANFNGGGQVVVGGHATAVAEAESLFRERGARRVVRLPVSAPFHTSLMRPAAERLAADLDRVRFDELSIPLWTNVDAAPIRSGDEARSALKRQVASPVRWEETLSGLAAEGTDRYVEVGEGRVLSGFVRRTAPGARTLQAGDPDGVRQASEEPE